MYSWNPWSIFDALERSIAGSSRWPQVDIEDTDDETILIADLPGMREDDVEVTVKAPKLIVRGERKPADARYVTRQRFHGSFERIFELGEAYDLDRVDANLADGVLTIRLAKAARAKPRRIKLMTGLVDKVKGLLQRDTDKEHNRAA
jgi:HSP20 family protein